MRTGSLGTLNSGDQLRYKKCSSSGCFRVGFAAFPGGYRNNNNGNFNNMGNNANFWSASENNTTNAWRRKLNYNNATVNRNNNNKRNGFSVRLVKDLINRNRGAVGL